MFRLTAVGFGIVHFQPLVQLVRGVEGSAGQKSGKSAFPRSGF
jgi:hypothetical protein